MTVLATCQLPACQRGRPLGRLRTGHWSV